MGSKGRPYRTVVVDGWEILIGRGDRENDELTFEVAEPRDYWLHVASGTPGSHVVVRVPEGEPEVPKAVLTRAAELSAWHSKARNARRVDVHVCRVRDVSKRRGAPAGEVHVRQWKVLRVAPSAGEEPTDP
jgi:predicted ribosome quality control (RQC) complex YloA/Tae2 family protein